MNALRLMFYQWIAGAVNGLILGCIAEILIKIIIFIELYKINSNSNEQSQVFVPEVIDLKAPFWGMVIGGFAKVFTWCFFKLKDNSIKNWQIVGVTFVLSHYLYSLTFNFVYYILFHDFNDLIPFKAGYWIVFLLSVSLYNLIFAITIRFVYKKNNYE